MPTGNRTSDRARVAYHEAAHFVVGHVLGVSAQYYVTIEPDGRILGAVGGDDFTAWTNPAQHAIAAVVVELFAGYYGDITFAPNGDTRAVQSSKDDFDKAKRQVARLSEDEDERKAIERLLRDAAWHLVAKHAVQIKELSTRLLECGRLNAQEARRVIELAGHVAADRESIRTLGSHSTSPFPSFPLSG